jgi:hypothetical protein
VLAILGLNLVQEGALPQMSYPWSVQPYSSKAISQEGRPLLKHVSREKGEHEHDEQKVCYGIRSLTLQMAGNWKNPAQLG